jgi:ribosomal protein S27E
MSFKLKCEKCGWINTYNCSDLNFDVIDENQYEVEYEARFEDVCNGCNNNHMIVYFYATYDVMCRTISRNNNKASGCVVVSNDCEPPINYLH